MVRETRGERNLLIGSRRELWVTGMVGAQECMSGRKMWEGDMGEERVGRERVAGGGWKGECSREKMEGEEGHYQEGSGIAVEQKIEKKANDEQTYS